MKNELRTIFAIMFIIRDNVFSSKNATSKNITNKISYLPKAGRYFRDRKPVNTSRTSIPLQTASTSFRIYLHIFGFSASFVKSSTLTPGAFERQFSRLTYLKIVGVLEESTSTSRSLPGFCSPPT